MLYWHSYIVYGPKCCALRIFEGEMQESGHIQNVTSSTIAPQQSIHHIGSRQSKAATTHNPSSIVLPEKRAQVITLRQNEVDTVNECADKDTIHEHRIDIGQEQSGLLGYEVFSGKLALDKRSKAKSADDKSGSGIRNPESVDAKLTSKALTWGSQRLSLVDVISVSPCCKLYPIVSLNLMMLNDI